MRQPEMLVDYRVQPHLDPTETDVLAAWLSAFRHHWPSAFAELLGEVGEASLQILLPKVAPDRYLKLRRIAIANLANLFRCGCVWAGIAALLLRPLLRLTLQRIAIVANGSAGRGCLYEAFELSQVDAMQYATLINGDVSIPL